MTLNESIYDALLKDMQIKLVYQPFESDTPKRYTLNPLALIVRDHYIYLVATKVGEENSFRLFSFYRIESAEPLYLDIEQPDTLELKQFIEKNYSRGFIYGGIESIELKVRRYSHEWLKFNKLHPEQVVSATDIDGWYNVKFEDYVTYELAGWIFKQSIDVIVESPQSLKDFIIESLQMYLRGYLPNALNK
ncbi:TPA: WYL domain-containing protein [Vibrio parahaemolyticus]